MLLCTVNELAVFVFRSSLDDSIEGGVRVATAEATQPTLNSYRTLPFGDMQAPASLGLLRLRYIKNGES